MIMDIQKIRTLLGLSADRPLSPEEKRRRIRYIVYPAMCLLFAGSLWLIYSPSEKERAAEEKEKGFNTDIPSPGQQRMDGNKVDAYEREELEKKDNCRKMHFRRWPRCSAVPVRIRCTCLKAWRNYRWKRRITPLQVPIILSVLLAVPTVT